MESTELVIIIAVFVVALMYSSVGHGGASGYLAVLGYFVIAQDVSKTTAFMLNIFVASIGAFQFIRAGYFSWRKFWPFAVASIPVSFLAQWIKLPQGTYKLLLGVTLVLAALRLVWKFAPDAEIQDPPIWLCLIVGALIGLLSGLVGVGGGIFLTPVLLLMNWSDIKTAAGVSAMFILVNSISGLIANFSKIQTLPPSVWIWLGAAIVGGLIGSTLGSRKFDTLLLRRVLGVVLAFAGINLAIDGFKLVFT
ncbi:MAG: sulfite exporter TauE/SafE family protein [Acidobacteriota bacterium]